MCWEDTVHSLEWMANDRVKAWFLRIMTGQCKEGETSIEGTKIGKCKTKQEVSGK